MNLKYIFDAITPENIKNIPVIQSAMDIFIQNLEKNSKVSKDIRKIYESDNENVKIALIKTYLNSLYNVISKAQTNKVVKNKIDQFGETNIPLMTPIHNILNEENSIVGKVQKQKTGTKIGIEYAYNLAKYLETGSQFADFNIEEVQPFHFKTDGSLFKEMYEAVVKPLGHPIGFTYDYSQIVKDSINDFFQINIIYDFKAIEIRCFSTSTYDVFTNDLDDTLIKADFLTRINPLTNILFKESEFYNQVTVNYGKTVLEFVDTTISNRGYRSLLFSDNTILEQYTNPIEVKYRTYSNYANDIPEYIKPYESHCSLFLDYNTDYEFTYTDEIDLFDETLEITKIKENNNGNSGQQYYNLTSGEYAFHVGGDEYVFAPGIDETMNEYVDDNAINIMSEINDKYNINISGYSAENDVVTIKIFDKYDNMLEVNSIVPDNLGNFNTNINIYQLRADIYKIYAEYNHNNVIVSSYIKTTGLNDFTPDFKITEVKDWNHVISNTLKVTGVGLPDSDIVSILTDSLGNTVTTSTTAASNGTFTLIISLALKEAGWFNIDFTSDDGTNIVNTFFESTDLRTYEENILLKLNTFSYDNGAPDVEDLLDYTALTDTEDMSGFESTNSTILKQIAEKAVDDTYFNADKSIIEYMLENSISDIDDLPIDLNIMGSYIEGSDYKLSMATDWLEEETFINYGRKIYPIDTSDFLIVTSADYCQDETLLYALSTTGYYAYTDEVSGVDLYLYTTDEFYLTMLPNLE
jgi:hypothetical protein